MIRTTDVTALLREVAETIVLPRFRTLDEGQVTEKRPGDLVTVADREAEDAIRAAILTDDPDALVVGEEAAFDDPSIIDGLRTAERAWVVDPIDGTRNFVSGSEHFAVMAAELREGIVVRSWILQPTRDIAYVAERGAGVYRDGERLRPVKREAPYEGTSSRQKWIGGEGRDIGQIWPAAWCCGFDYTRLLDGRTDFTIYRTGKPWDHLPGYLMLHEVGGTVRTFDGERIKPGINGPGLVACANETVLRALLPLVNDDPRSL